MRNMLLHARGDGTFAQVADFAGVAATDWTWGSAFLDVDLDGYEDLLTVNGHRWDIRDADTFERIRTSSPRIPWNREQGEFPSLETHSIALRNRGDLTFENANAAWGFGADAAVTQGIALADLDGDGDLDVVASRLNAPPAVYRNRSSAGRIAVRLRGASGNAEGVGASVTVRAAGLPAQTREVTAGGYYLSSSDAQLTFATGGDSTPSVIVRWRDGATDSLVAGANRLYEITEGAHPAVRGTARDTRPLFVNATPLLKGLTHADVAFDDYARQPLLPGKLSQLGPGLAWIDINGDGRDDLVMGTGRGGRIGVMINDGGTFHAAAGAGAVAPWDLTAIAPVPDGAGRLRLLAGQSSYEAPSPREALAIPSVISIAVDARGNGSSATALLGGDTASVGPLAVGDVNGDGRLDLFVGARAEPGAWPLARRSRLLLHNADGSWTPDATNDRAMHALGLVSAAAWADINGDGWQDLVVTSEWGPVRVLLNDKGALRDATESLGLTSAFSRWNGVNVGDFDGDGRLDIVATSWGRNTPWRASAARPHELYVGRFGTQGVGLVFARTDSASGADRPLEPFTRLAGALLPVRDHVRSFTDYSRVTVDELLKMVGGSAIRLGATTYDHMVFLNRGATFEARPLPAQAQMAPAFGVVVADFDGDGAEDLFLAQNFSPTDQETPRFDAGAGLVLLGDGRGEFRPLSVGESGVSVLGDGRGAAAGDFDGDGRVDLAVAQNGAAATLWRNATGRAGQWVRVDGGADNPWGFGAVLRVVRGDRRGRAVAVRGVAGYWSADSPRVVLHPERGDSIWIRWPGGREATYPSPDAKGVVITAAGASARTSSR
jgi:hypothetical protein